MTIPAGETEASFNVKIDGDGLVEGDETFEVVVIAHTNAELPNNAAALVATGTIFDRDDVGGDPAGGPGGPARLIYGPDSASDDMPTLDVRKVTIVEGNAAIRYQDR